MKRVRLWAVTSPDRGKYWQSFRQEDLCPSCRLLDAGWKPVIKERSFVPDGSGFQLDEFHNILLAPSVVPRVDELFPGQLGFERISERIVMATPLIDVDFAPASFVECYSYCQVCDRYAGRILGDLDGLMALNDVDEHGIYRTAQRFGRCPVLRPLVLCGDGAKEKLSKASRFLEFDIPFTVSVPDEALASTD